MLDSFDLSSFSARVYSHRPLGSSAPRRRFVATTKIVGNAGHRPSPELSSVAVYISSLTSGGGTHLAGPPPLESSKTEVLLGKIILRKVLV